MGVYSTKILTRAEVEALIKEEIDTTLNSRSNENLCEILFSLIGEKELNNFLIED